MSITSRNRDYTTPPDTHSQVFLRGWADTATNSGIPGQTGLWRAVALDNNGYVQTTIAGGITLSGVSVSIDSVAVTGSPVVSLTGNTPVSIVNPVLATSGIATLTSVPTHNVAVTGGSIQTIVTGNIGGNVTVSSVAITGNPTVVVSGSNPIWVTGNFSATVNSVAVTGFSPSIAPLAVSGVVQASVSSGPIVDAVATGNARALTTNVLLSGVSGLLAGNLTDTALVNDVTGNLYLAAISGLLGANLSSATWVTGGVSIVNTAPINVTGIINTVVTGSVSSSITNPIGVTGVKTDLNSTIWGSSAVPYTLVPMGGRAVAATGAGSITGGYVTGDYVMFAFNKDNGGLLVNQKNLDYTQDTVTVSGWNTGLVVTTVPSTTSVVSNDAVSGIFQVAVPALTTRRAWFIQNLHTGAMMVRFSNSMPSTGDLNFILKGGSAINDGNGASWSDSPAIYTGPVSVSGVGGAPLLYTAWQM